MNKPIKSDTDRIIDKIMFTWCTMYIANFMLWLIAMLVFADTLGRVGDSLHRIETTLHTSPTLP